MNRRGEGHLRLKPACLQKLRGLVMLASISVLQGSAAGITNYYGDYTASEGPGTWLCSGASQLNLSGNAAREHLERLLAGLHPHRSQVLTGTRPKRSTEQADPHKPDRERAPGFDITFSAGKDVSAVWVAGDAITKKQIEKAFRSAVAQTLKWFESNVPLTRRGRAGHRREMAKLIGAMFLHTESRELQPQLHVHVVLPNVVQRLDGKWGTLDSRMLHHWTMTLGAICRANFGTALTRMGFEIESSSGESGKSKGFFKIAGVSERLCRKWSLRSQQIDRAIAGVSKLNDRSGRARNRANLKTRRRKDKAVDRAKLQQEWRQEAREYGLDERAVQRLMSHPRPEFSQDSYQQAFQGAVKELTESDSHFNERKVIEAVCKSLASAGISGTRIAKAVKRDLEKSPDIFPLGQHRGEECFTTREMWQLEDRLLKNVEALRQQSGITVDPITVEGVIRSRTGRIRLPGKKPLSPEQVEAVQNVLCRSGSIHAIRGVAGAGKSTTLDAIREIFERSGATVIGGALSGAAKEELNRASKIPSRTVESFEYHLDSRFRWQRFKNRVWHDTKQCINVILERPTHRLSSKVKLDKHTVLILDEASMIDTRTLDSLVEKVKAKQATLILVGDDRQLQAIGPGGAFSKIGDRLGAIHLDKNFRQQVADDREAVHDLRHGDAKNALSNYAKRGLVTVAKDRGEAVSALIDSWAKHGGLKRPRDHVIFTQTRQEAATINRECQARRHKAGRIMPLLSVKKGDERFYIGDRVMFHRSFGPGIQNGSTARVIGVDPVLGRVKVLLDDKPSSQAKKLGARRMVSVPLRKLADGDLTLAYAMTTHKMQGATCHNSYLLTGGNLTHRELAYVQATRARHVTRWFVDELHAGPELQDLAKAMEKSRPKEMAHSVAEKSRDRPALELRLERTPGDFRA